MVRYAALWYLTMPCGMLSYATYAAINFGDVLQVMRLSCNALRQLFSELARHAALRYVALRHLMTRCAILCYAMLSYGLANAIWTRLKPLMLVPVCVK